jgi:tetratricopeptide (TPR) repeat protein
MATKTKTSETPAQVPVSPVEKVFSEGLELLNAGKLAEAAKAFEYVQTEAVSQERLNLSRTARGYLTAIQTRLDAAKTLAPETLEMTVQLLLNQQDATQAVELLAKGLEAHPDRAILHYLNAVAFAQLEQVQPSADALAQAISLDADFLYQFRLESDFDGLRQQAPFAVLLKG